MIVQYHTSSGLICHYCRDCEPGENLVQNCTSGSEEKYRCMVGLKTHSLRETD